MGLKITKIKFSAKEKDHGEGIDDSQAASGKIQRKTGQLNRAFRYSKSQLDEINHFYLCIIIF